MPMRVESVYDVLTVVNRGIESIAAFNSDKWLDDRPFATDISSEEYSEYGLFDVAVYNALVEVQSELMNYVEGSAERLYDQFVADAYVSEVSEDFPPLQVADNVANMLGYLLEWEESGRDSVEMRKDASSEVRELIQLAQKHVQELKDFDVDREWLANFDWDPYPRARRSRSETEEIAENYYSLHERGMDLLEYIAEYGDDAAPAEAISDFSYVIDDITNILRNYKGDVEDEFPTRAALNEVMSLWGGMDIDRP